MDGDQAVGIPDVDLGQESTAPKLHNDVDGAIHFRVGQSEFIGVNAVIDTSALGEGKVDNDKSPFAGTTTLKGDAKSADVEGRERWRREDAGDPANGHLSRQVGINHLRVLQGGAHVPRSQLERGESGWLETNTEASREARES